MNKKFIAQTGLLLVTIIWGLTFIMVKEALNDAPPFSFSTIRFGLASTLILIILNKKILSLAKQELYGGIICGIFLFLGYAFQNFGLMNTSATKSAFITSISTLMVPMLLVLLKIQKIQSQIWISVILATIGLYMLILPSGGINIGDIITFGCAVCFALHIISQNNYIKSNIRLLPFFYIQMLCVTIISFVNAIIFEPNSIIWSSRLIIALIITGVFATFFAFLIMIWSQKILNPSETAIIFALEPVSASIFAVLFASEVLGLWGWVGGGLVCVAVIYGESG